MNRKVNKSVPFSHVPFSPMSSVKVEFSDLWTCAAGDSNERLPIGRLGRDSIHVHGCLRIEVGGKALPYLGYFGPDDVCFNEWIFELKSAVTQLQAAARGSYSYDEGEQGQPAFLFEREDDALFVSIVDSQLSDGRAHPEWQRVRCEFSDFGQSVEAFLSSLRTHLEREAPGFTEEWWSRTVERAA